MDERSQSSTKRNLDTSPPALRFPPRLYWANSLNVKLARLLYCFWLGLLWLVSVPPVQGDPPRPGHRVDFSDQVRPILARHCFKCHGPDEKARKARLRLDLGDEAMKPAGSGERPIVPGRPDESELVRRIFAEDAEERMPPAEAKLPLSEGDRQVLKQWVAEGAKYETHWAFRKPVRPLIPAVRDPAWVKNPIDAFVLARIEAAGLRPSPEADRATLLRRVSLDLVGLPPTPEELDAFLADMLPDAYERQVDRLLASPQYGERWARRWLDLARYADTNGYEKDRPRSIWPYRDWVIHALNADMPFDRFTIEQLAGDMQQGAGPEQKVATGFHRNTMLNEEGGIDPLEFRFYAMTDRVATTATVWLGSDARLCPVPHAQVRPDPAPRVLPVHGALEQCRRAGDGGPLRRDCAASPGAPSAHRRPDCRFAPSISDGSKRVVRRCGFAGESPARAHGAPLSGMARSRFCRGGALDGAHARAGRF